MEIKIILKKNVNQKSNEYKKKKNTYNSSKIIIINIIPKQQFFGHKFGLKKSVSNIQVTMYPMCCQSTTQHSNSEFRPNYMHYF